jgi:uncharacterized membrane protein YgcG
MRQVVPSVKARPATTVFVVFVAFVLVVLTFAQARNTVNITKLNRGACAQLSLRDCAYSLYGALTPREREIAVRRIDRIQRRLDRQVKNVHQLQVAIRMLKRRESHAAPRGSGGGSGESLDGGSGGGSGESGGDGGSTGGTPTGDGGGSTPSSPAPSVPSQQQPSQPSEPVLPLPLPDLPQPQPEPDPIIPLPELPKLPLPEIEAPDLLP